MSTNLEELTKKLYDEGVGKANAEAEAIIAEAKKKADEIVSAAKAEAKKIADKSAADAENLKKKSESDIAMAARNAEAKLKQTITELLSGSVAANMSSDLFEDVSFVQQLVVKLIEKWSPAGETLDIALTLPEKDKTEIAKFVTSKYKALLDKGLEIKVGNLTEGFSIGPKDGGYQVTFTEELFNAFFSQYLRGISKELLYK